MARMGFSSTIAGLSKAVLWCPAGRDFPTGWLCQWPGVHRHLSLSGLLQARRNRHDVPSLRHHANLHLMQYMSLWCPIFLQLPQHHLHLASVALLLLKGRRETTLKDHSPSVCNPSRGILSRLQDALLSRAWTQTKSIICPFRCSYCCPVGGFCGAEALAPVGCLRHDSCIACFGRILSCPHWVCQHLVQCCCLAPLCWSLPGAELLYSILFFDWPVHDFESFHQVANSCQ